jgi:hypothetical protein
MDVENDRRDDHERGESGEVEVSKDTQKNDQPKPGKKSMRDLMREAEEQQRRQQQQ